MSEYGNGYDDGYRAGMQHVRDQITSGATLPPGFTWELVHEQDPNGSTQTYRRMVGPAKPVTSDQIIADLRARLTAG